MRLAVATRGALPVERECSSRLEEMSCVVISVSAAVPAPQQLNKKKKKKITRQGVFHLWLGTPASVERLSYTCSLHRPQPGTPVLMSWVHNGHALVPESWMLTGSLHSNQSDLNTFSGTEGCVCARTHRLPGVNKPQVIRVSGTVGDFLVCLSHTLGLFQRSRNSFFIRCKQGLLLTCTST